MIGSTFILTKIHFQAQQSVEYASFLKRISSFVTSVKDVGILIFFITDPTILALINNENIFVGTEWPNRIEDPQ